MAALMLTACGSERANCSPCPGDALVSDGLVRGGENVTDLRVCLDGMCETQRYVQGFLVLIRPPDSHRIRTIVVTTLDHGTAVRTFTGGEIDLPKPKKGHGPCGCHARDLRYDVAAERFVVTRT
jgi:hypothetical protein